MRLDAHVHTCGSHHDAPGPWRPLAPRSHTTPERAYALAMARGMQLFAITDRDDIGGALSLAGRPGVVVGCEVTATFPEDGVQVHLNVFGLDGAQHRAIERLRHDIRRLLPLLQEQRLFTSLNHVASRVTGPLTAAHVVALLPWIDALEVRNGSRLATQNRTAESLALAAGKAGLGGSDAHTARGIGRTWTEVPGATTAEEFFAGLRRGEGVVGGCHGSGWTLASDVVRTTASRSWALLQDSLDDPWSPRTPGRLSHGLSVWPRAAVRMGAGLFRLAREQRFNRDLLFDLVARPAVARALEVEAAA